MRPMQQANMTQLHQPQHLLPHRNPHQPILSMPPHQQHMHHMQHPGPPHGNPRQPMLMGMNAHNTNSKEIYCKRINLHSQLLRQKLIQKLLLQIPWLALA